MAALRAECGSNREAGLDNRQGAPSLTQGVEVRVTEQSNGTWSALIVWSGQQGTTSAFGFHIEADARAWCEARLKEGRDG